MILLDHGFYRKYDDEFRKNYSELWISLVKNDTKRVQEISNLLGINEFYKYLPMILLYKSRHHTKLGQEFTKEEKEKMHKNQ